MDDSENGKWIFLPKHSSTFLSWVCMLKYLPHVDTAKEAFELDTNSGIKVGGRFNLSKDAGVKPPIFEYLGLFINLGDNATPGATLIRYNN